MNFITPNSLKFQLFIIEISDNDLSARRGVNECHDSENVSHEMLFMLDNESVCLC